MAKTLNATTAPKANVDPTKGATITASQAPFLMQPLHETTPYLKMLVYSKHGIGKTELAGSSVDVAEMRDVLYLDAEGGSMTLRESKRIKHPELITSIPISSFKTTGYIHEFLRLHCEARDKNNIPMLKKLQSRATGVPLEAIQDSDIKRFKTVIIDSMTEVETYSMYGLLGLDIDKLPDDEMQVADWPVFRKNLENVKLVIRAYRNLPINLIIICAEQYVQDERKIMHYSPQLTGKLSAQVQGFVDIVGRLVVGMPTESNPQPRRLYVQPVTDGPRFDAKNRKAAFTGPYLDDPNMTMIMQKIGLVAA